MSSNLSRGLAKAIRLHEIGRFKDAVDVFEEQLALEPDSALAHRMLGLSLFRLGRLVPAFESVKEAIRLEPNNPHNYFAMAMVRMVYRWPDVKNGQTPSQRMRALRKSGYHSRLYARQAIQQAIALKPDYGDYWALLSSIEAAAGFWANCLMAANRTLEVGPTHPSGYRFRAKALAILGRWDEATADFDQAIRLAPNNADIHRARGSHMIQLGRPDEAVEHFTESLRLNPNQKSLPSVVQAARFSGRFKPYGLAYRFILRTGRGQQRRLMFLICILPVLAALVEGDWIVKICALIGLEGFAILSFGPLLDRRLWADPVERAQIGQAGYIVARVATWSGLLMLIAVLFACFPMPNQWLVADTPSRWIAWAVLPWLAIPLSRAAVKLVPERPPLYQ
jgi:tetratricopeptide (TPR) repeat protein